MRLVRSLLSLLPWVLGAVGLGITGWLWQHEQGATQRALKADFDFSVRQTASRVESRMADYEQMLRGLQGLFVASGAIELDEFNAYVGNLLAGADFAGIQYFAYAPKAPDGAGVAASAKIAYVAPSTTLNLDVVGEDPYADPARRPAMQWAADSSVVGVTPQFLDRGSPERAPQRGFLMFLPVYAKGQPVDSAASRRAALVGWVIAGIRMNDLMSSLYGEGTPGIGVRVHDGLELSRQSLMYESSPERDGTQRPRFEALEYIGFAGHTWTLAVSARPEFAQRFGSDAAPIIAWSGFGGSLLVLLLTRQLVSARQRANDVAASMTSELRASEERYRRIVETADEGIWMTDLQPRTVFVNPKLAQMLGYTIDEILDHTPAELLDDAHASDVEQALTTGRPGGAEPRELRFRRKDGAALWASLTTTLIFDAAGRPEGALSMVTDITARKHADAARFELEAQLRESQKMEAIGTLAGGIAHDFNNVLAAILGNAAMAQDRATADPALNNHLEQIGKAAGRARSLVQQILAFSRRQPHRLVVLTLRPVIEEAVRLLRPVLPAQAELECALADSPLHVMADSTQLQQVVMNLCTNAWHALNGRAGRITIGLRAVSFEAEAARRLGLPAGGHAHLSVSDTGSGMDEATRARVFEPFFTTKPVGQGTGLGLSVVHGIVASHGGAITVSSAPGQGSRFDLYFPLLARPSAVSPANVGIPESALSAGGHVAYVDDDPVMVAMVQALLERAGFRVTCFEDPRDAIAAVGAQPNAFDVVITDHNMPVLSGLDVAAALSRLCPGLPVVVSSGYVTEELVTAAKRVGARHVLQKEYTLEQLPGIVHTLLAGQPVVGD